MKPAAVLALILCNVGLLLGDDLGHRRLGEGGRPGDQQQTFRTATDAVTVDASVRSGGKMVAGLTAADFVLNDNGVRQTIDSIEQSAVPIDLTMVVDTSGNPARPWTGGSLDTSKIVHALDAEVRQVMNQLRPTDRIRVLAIDRYVRQLVAFTPVSAYRNLRVVEIDGLASTYDTLTAAMLHGVEPWRRHLVVARTMGRDSMSGTTAAAVGGIAERSDGLVHLVLSESALDKSNLASWFSASKVMMNGPTNRFWMPARHQLVASGEIHTVTPDGLLVQAGVRASGGEWYQSVLISEPSLVGTFKRVFDEYRQGYVLRYTPKGVTPSGWHTIEVTVPKLRGARVTARRGYGIEPPRVAPAPAVPAIPRTVADFVAAYERQAYQNVRVGLQQITDAAKFLKEFEDGGNPWPASPRREAALAIELAEAGLFSGRVPTRDQAEALMAKFTRFVRHPFEPDQFEKQWHYALISLSQGTLRPNALDVFATRALDRFPTEPRFLLARAIAADQRTAAGGVLRWSQQSPAQAASVDAARKLFENLLGMRDVAAEARIRLGFLDIRQGQYEAALARLDEVVAFPEDDAMLPYLHQLFRGHALAELGRIDESLASYRSALAKLPSGQSARVAIMNLAYRQGDSKLAESLAEEVQRDTAQYIDPWWIYWQGQYRLYPQIIARLRELAR